MDDALFTRELANLRALNAELRARITLLESALAEARRELDAPVRRELDAANSRAYRARRRVAPTPEQSRARSEIAQRRAAARVLRAMARTLAFAAHDCTDATERTRVIALSQDLIRSATRVRGRLPALFARRQ